MGEFARTAQDPSLRPDIVGGLLSTHTRFSRKCPFQDKAAADSENRIARCKAACRRRREQGSVLCRAFDYLREQTTRFDFHPGIVSPQIRSGDSLRKLPSPTSTGAVARD